jgi:MoxR-like ATPase
MEKTLTIENFKPQGLKIDKKDPNGRRTAYIFEEKMCNALWAAYANGRPLLLRGDPGTGKSEMAYAIAAHLGWPLRKKVIQGNTEIDDLHFHFDAVQRLADAQIYRHLPDEKADGRSQILAIEKYVTPGPIWWALNWVDAKKASQNKKESEKTPEGWQPGDGCVLLIDEIDKADPDLPNGLLETFGNRCFEVPLLGEEIRANQPVLTIITTNEERDLPLPFLRRCLELELKLETDEHKREDWLIERGKLHFSGKIDNDVYRQASQLVWEQRLKAEELNRYQPGLAEYLDLLGALCHAKPAEQGKILAKISNFVLEKG